MAGPVIDAADLLSMLEEVGVGVTCGGVSTLAKVDPADEQLLAQAGQPVALVGRAISVLLLAGVLPALRAGVVFSVDAGPQAGAYVAEPPIRGRDGVSCHFLAFPTEEAPADLWIRGRVLLPWASRSDWGPEDSEPFDLEVLGGIAGLHLDAGPATAGEHPTLDVRVRHADTEAGPFADAALALAGDPDHDAYDVLSLDHRGGHLKRWIVIRSQVYGTFPFRVWLSEPPARPT